ncbi:MAG: hypothetical protein WA109_11350 [Bellilinea sp.]
MSPVWTPWTPVILKFLNWPLVVAITLFAIIYRAFRYNRSPWPIALAVLSLPTMWVLYLGNLDGLVLAGLLLLPWGVPLAAMKPQLAAFALLAKKSSIVAGVVWGLISLAIWGLWPLNFMNTLTPDWRVEWVQDISLFPWGIFIALPLLWLSRGDEDLLMAAGSFVTPHLFPYHFILLMPSLARMNPIWMVVTWFVSWTPLLANWVGPIGWRMGNVLAACIWLGIYFGKRMKLTKELAENVPAAALNPQISAELPTID